MARAKIRANQILDADLLTEAEHYSLVHQNLTTSGVLNFQDGTISGTGNIYAEEFKTTSGEALYTQSQVDTLITTLSGALQAQIDSLGALLI